MASGQIYANERWSHKMSCSLFFLPFLYVSYIYIYALSQTGMEIPLHFMRVLVCRTKKEGNVYIYI